MSGNETLVPVVANLSHEITFKITKTLKLLPYIKGELKSLKNVYLPVSSSVGLLKY